MPGRGERWLPPRCLPESPHPPRPTGAESCCTLPQTPSLRRLNWLEEQLVRCEKYNFTGSMIETYMFKFMTEHFRGLNISSRMVGPPNAAGAISRGCRYPPGPLCPSTPSGRCRGMWGWLTLAHTGFPSSSKDALHQQSLLRCGSAGVLQAAGAAGPQHCLWDKSRGF